MPPLVNRPVLLLPLVLSVVALVEDLAWTAMRPHIHGVHLRVLVRLVLVGAAFAIAARRVEPLLRDGLRAMRTGSRKRMGSFGPWAFYVVAYGVVYLAYYVVETRGPRALLP